MARHNISGQKAELLSADYLTTKGYKIIERNYRDRFSEIDIICINQEYIVFVEVKYRARRDFGGAIGAITPNKLLRMQKAAEYYLSQHQEFNKLQPRLDVVTVVGDIVASSISHIEDCSLY